MVHHRRQQRIRPREAQLLERGDRVAGTVRNLDSVRDLTEKYGDRFWAARLDVTDTAEIRKVVDAAFSALGTIDVVVNNAGYGLFGAAEECTDEQVVHEIATNLLGSIQVVRSALPHLRAQQRARIIQISTFGGQTALPGGSMYHASKWGIEGFSEALMAELVPFNIGVTIIEPGGARTSFRHGSAQLAALDAYAGTPAVSSAACSRMKPNFLRVTRPRWRRSSSAAGTRLRHLSGSCWQRLLRNHCQCAHPAPGRHPAAEGPCGFDRFRRHVGWTEVAGHDHRAKRDGLPGRV